MKTNSFNNNYAIPKQNCFGKQIIFSEKKQA